MPIGLIGFDSESGDMHGESELHQITHSVGPGETDPSGIEGDEVVATTGKGALVKWHSTTPTFYTLDHTTTKSYTNPLIEYSFSFGDCYTAVSGDESSYHRVGVNIFKRATTDDDDGTLIHACGSIKEDGTISESTANLVEAGGASGYGGGRNPSYTPVYMRFIYKGTISNNETIRLKIAATDIVKVRIRDVLLTIKKVKLLKYVH